MKQYGDKCLNVNVDLHYQGFWSVIRSVKHREDRLKWPERPVGLLGHHRPVDVIRLGDRGVAHQRLDRQSVEPGAMRTLASQWLSGVAGSNAATS